MIEPLESRLAGYFHFSRAARRAAARSSDATGRRATLSDRAIALANSPAEAAHIRMHLDRLMRESDATTADKAAK